VDADKLYLGRPAGLERDDRVRQPGQVDPVERGLHAARTLRIPLVDLVSIKLR
jgi:hypothetical protein